MADFTLYDGDYSENRISVLPILEKERLVDFQMYLGPDNTEHIVSFNQTDITLLRDYLTSVISIFEKQ